jgi:hypothetical protein
MEYKYNIWKSTFVLLCPVMRWFFVQLIFFFGRGNNPFKVKFADSLLSELNESFFSIFFKLLLPASWASLNSFTCTRPLGEKSLLLRTSLHYICEIHFSALWLFNSVHDYQFRANEKPSMSLPYCSTGSRVERETTFFSFTQNVKIKQNFAS